MRTVFWTIFFTIFYCYLGYPAALSLLARLRPRSIRKSRIFPAVSVILSIYNEEDTIEAKLNNLLFLDYPQDKFEIIVGSDGSTDRTNAIIKNFRDSRIQFHENARRYGKMATLNRLVTAAKGEILVFTDARQIFAKNAINELVNNFADPLVGCVSGELIFSKETSVTGRGINLYWEYEKFIRKNESRIHSMLGATGAIYAIRRELFEKGPDNTILDDMFIPLKIIQKGYRAVFDEKAEAYDKVAESPREEHRRKARTLFGNYQIFCMVPAMFNPMKSPIALQLFSHKFLRVVMPFLLMAVFVLNFLLRDNFLFRVFFILQIIFYTMAMIGALLRYQSRGILKTISTMCYIPYVFCLLNFSALVGFFRFLGSRQEIAWGKARIKQC